jgi:hypothetical protein
MGTTPKDGHLVAADYFCLLCDALKMAPAFEDDFLFTADNCCSAFPLILLSGRSL